MLLHSVEIVASFMSVVRATSPALLEEILDAWFAGEPSAEDDDRANIGHLADIEGGAADG